MLYQAFLDGNGKSKNVLGILYCELFHGHNIWEGIKCANSQFFDRFNHVHCESVAISDFWAQNFGLPVYYVYISISNK